MEAPRRQRPARAGLEGAPAVIRARTSILVGGVTSPTRVLASSVRANTAPQSPFFQLGLVGATVPGLKIEGEIGQQLGYLNAAGVGTVNFILLILIGWAFAHKAQTRAIIAPASLRHGGAASSTAAAEVSPPGRSPFARLDRCRGGPAGRPAPRRPSRRPR